jgi:hypothetical protein
MLLAVIIKQNSILPNLLNRRLAEDRQRVNRELHILLISTFFNLWLETLPKNEDTKILDYLLLALD